MIRASPMSAPAPISHPGKRKSAADAPGAIISSQLGLTQRDLLPPERAGPNTFVRDQALSFGIEPNSNQLPMRPAYVTAAKGDARA
jgi:hypothetical protein